MKVKIQTMLNGLACPHAVPIFSPMTRYSFLEESKVTTLHSSVSLYLLIIGASTLGLGVMVNPALAILSGTSLPDTMPK